MGFPGRGADEPGRRRAGGDVAVEPGRWDLPFGSLPQATADHLVALVAQAAQAPTAMVHLLQDELLRLLGAVGLPEWWAAAPSIPVSTTLGGLVIAQGMPVVISDVAVDTRVPPEAPEAASGARAYAGFPIHDADGELMGVCAVLDYQPRLWQPEQLSAVDEGAQACTALVVEQRSAARADDARRLLAALLDSLQTGVAACDADGRLVFSNVANEDLNGAMPHDIDLRAWTRQQVAHAPATSLPPATFPWYGPWRASGCTTPRSPLNGSGNDPRCCSPTLSPSSTPPADRSGRSSRCRT